MKKKFIFVFIAIILSITFTLIIVEILLRIFSAPPPKILIKKNEQINLNYKMTKIKLAHHIEEKGLYLESPSGRRLRPNTTAIIENHILSNKKVIITTNSLGYRNREIKHKKGERILFLGDSITLADYLSDTETFVRQIENIFFKNGINIETINAGVGTIGIQEELAILNETGLKTEPDIVILNFYLNDFIPSQGISLINLPDWLKNFYLANFIYKYLSIIFINDEFTKFHNIKEQKVWIKEIANNYGLTISNNQINSEKNKFEKEINKNKFDWGIAWSNKAWSYITPFFYEFVRLSQIYNFKFAIVIFPVREQIYTEEVFDFPQKKLKKICEDSNVPYLDLLPALRKFKNKDWKLLFYDQCHHTSYGSQIIAENIVEFLTSHFKK